MANIQVELLDSNKNVIKYNGNYYYNDGILIGKNIIYNKQEKCLRFDNNIYNLSNSEKISLLLEVFLEHPKIPLSIEYIISELEKKNSKIYVPFFVKNKGKHKTYIGKIISQGKRKSQFMFIFKYIQIDKSREKFSYKLNV